MWRKGKRDKNEKPIIDKLEELGGQAERLTNQVLDFIIWHRNIGTAILEIKDVKTPFQRSQIKFMSKWKGLVFIIKSVDDVEPCITNPRDNALTPRQKEKLAGLLLIDKRETFPAKFLEEFLSKWK